MTTSTITFEDLQALAIDTAALPPMRDGKRKDIRGKSDPKRGRNAKRDALARRQARAAKVVA